MGSILPSLHEGLQSALGETYYHSCVPAPLRRALWRRLTREGREADAEVRMRLKALRELRAEMAAASMEDG